MECKIQYYENSGRAWCGIHNRDESSYLRAKLSSANLQNGEQAKAIRNVQRALERNENREINMGEAWALIKEAVGVTEKRIICDCGEPGCNMLYDHRK